MTPPKVIGHETPPPSRLTATRSGAGSRPDAIRAGTVRLRATSQVQLACWKRQGEDAPVASPGENELKGVADRWRLYRAVSGQV